MLLLLLQLLPMVASEATTPVTFIKPLETCPEVGYFFERELSNKVEPGPCYLCFCKGTDHAVCSLRASERCDQQYYSHRKREARQRRSPGFFQGVVKGNSKSSQGLECRPLKSSKSIGCPPDDWCKGCTVCDCNTKGRWDCHVMSFCPTQKPTRIPRKKPKKSLPKEPNNSQRNQKLPHSAKVTTSTRRTLPLKKLEKKPAPNAKDNKPGKKIVKKSIANVPIQPMITVETKRQFQKKTTKDSPIIIKKYISTNSPIKSPELLKYKNDTKKFAQMLYKHYKSNMNNSTNQMKKWSSRAMGDKLVNKRSLLNKKLKLTSLNARKSMNTKEHKNKSKMMNMNNKTNKSYDMIKNKKLNYNAKQFKGKKYDHSKRNKRDVTVATTTLTLKSTNVESLKTGNTTVPVNKILEATEISFKNNEDVASNLSNYAYTVDNHVTLSMNTTKPITDDTEYVTTEKNKGDVTVDNYPITSNNLTVTEKQRDNKENTVKHNVTASNCETTAIVSKTDNIIAETKVMPANFNTLIDNKPPIGNYQNSNETENTITPTKNVTDGQDIKKMFTGRKKFSLKKVVKILNARTKKYYTKNDTLGDSKSTSIRINGTLNDIQSVLDKLLHGFIRNNTKDKLKKKSNTAVKYLKKLFSKLFSVSSNNNRTGDDKIAVMDSICENFGPCKISVKKLGVLNYKVNQLISETHKALNSIKIIKGLLLLIEDGKTENNENNTAKEPEFKMHVKKLNAILKDSYAPEDQLTQTQQTQIYYIKSNTEVFIKSIGKFANILNDIINLIKSENTKKERRLHSYKIIKNNHSGVQERGVVGKIKNLLLRYNLLQNTFLLKMYEALTTLEVQNRNAKMYNFKRNRKGSEKMYKVEIEKYVDNINFNLKKLKDLVAKVGNKDRRKRDTMGDDEAIEYLLTVMEYLLKRNNSLESPPDNDGIDLLIEAIKSAPDIKPIKKKVLQYVPVKITGSADSAESREENVSNPKKVSNKIATEVTKTIKKVVNEPEDNDVVRENRRKTLDTYTKPVEITTKSDIVVADLSDLITEYPSKVYMATYDNYEYTGKSFFDKAVSDVKTNSETVTALKKGDSAKDDESDIIGLDEDNVKLIQNTTTESFAEIQTEPRIVSSTHKIRTEKGKMRYYSPLSSEYTKKSSKKTKTKFDLINDAYEEEINEQKTLTTRRPDPIRSKGETGNRDKKKLISDVSSITKEIDDVKEKKESEDLMYRKQMDLLNSLDYGTEKSLPDDSDSKDFSPVDRLNNDPFPNYFV